MQHIAAAPELVRNDSQVGNDGRDGRQYAGNPSVARLENVRHSHLPEMANAACNKINEYDTGPGAGAGPQPRHAVAIPQSGAAEQGTAPHPGSKQRAHQHPPVEPAARHHEIFPRLHDPTLVVPDPDQSRQINKDREDVGIGKKARHRCFSENVAKNPTIIRRGVRKWTSFPPSSCVIYV